MCCLAVEDSFKHLICLLYTVCHFFISFIHWESLSLMLFIWQLVGCLAHRSDARKVF